jgi:hypothetical protein
VPGHGGLHPLGQRRRRGFAGAEAADERQAAERLHPEPAEDQHDEPQSEANRPDPRGNGQAAVAASRGIGEDVMSEDGGGVGRWHGPT